MGISMSCGTAPVSTQSSLKPQHRSRTSFSGVLLPMGASMQLCAVTSYITAKILRPSLAWILPLGVYQQYGDVMYTWVSRYVLLSQPPVR